MALARRNYSNEPSNGCQVQSSIPRGQSPRPPPLLSLAAVGMDVVLVFFDLLFVFPIVFFLTYRQIGLDPFGRVGGSCEGNDSANDEHPSSRAFVYFHS